VEKDYFLFWVWLLGLARVEASEEAA
jgi:hypothetical protein